MHFQSSGLNSINTSTTTLNLCLISTKTNRERQKPLNQNLNIVILPEGRILGELEAPARRRCVAAAISISVAVAVVVETISDAPKSRGLRGIEVVSGRGFGEARSGPNRVGRVVVEPEPALDRARGVGYERH